MLLQRADGGGDGEVRLARARRTDRERHGRRADRVDVALLSDRLRRDALAARREELVAEHLARAQRRAAVVVPALDHLDGLAHGGVRELVAALEQGQELFEDAADALGLGRRPGDRDLVAADQDLAVERRLDQLQERVTLAEERHHRLVTRNEDLHLVGGVRQVRLSRGGAPFPPVSNDCRSWNGLPGDSSGCARSSLNRAARSSRDHPGGGSAGGTRSGRRRGRRS